MKEENIRLYVIASALFMLFMLVIMLIILWIVVTDHYQPSLVWICDDKTGIAFFQYEDRYVRDLSYQEKRRYCPKPTVTATPYGNY